MKKAISTVLVVATVLVSVFCSGVSLPFGQSPSFTQSGVESPALELSAALLTEIQERYADVQVLEGTELDAHIQKVDSVLLNGNLDSSQKKLALESLGVYDIQSGPSVQLAASGPGNVSLKTPTIRYDSSAAQYVIEAYGNWTAHTYEVPTWSWWAPAVGSTKDIGGLDAIGISITNASGSTTGLALKSGYGYFHNGTATRKVTTLSTNNDNRGGGYKVQDFILFTKVDNYLLWANTTYYYNAYNMDCILRYNSSFANYSGNAKLFYGHSWESTSVSSIGLTTTGASIGWTKTSDHWDAYSYGKTFTKGK